MPTGMSANAVKVDPFNNVRNIQNEVITLKKPLRINGSKIQDKNIIIKIDNKSYYKTIPVTNPKKCKCECHQIDDVLL